MISSGVDCVLCAPNIICGVVDSHNVVPVHSVLVEEYHFEVCTLIVAKGRNYSCIFLEDGSEAMPYVLLQF